MLAEEEEEVVRNIDGRSGGGGIKKKKEKGRADMPWAQLTKWRNRSKHPALLALKEVMMDFGSMSQGTICHCYRLYKCWRRNGGTSFQ